MARRDKDSKREKRNKIIIGLILSFFMITGILGVFQGDTGETLFYNEQKFEKVNNVYYTEINDVIMGFNYYPAMLENITVTGNIRNVYDNSQVLVYNFDPDSPSLTQIEYVRYDLAQNLAKPSTATITKKSPIYQLPISTCANSTYPVPVVYFKDGSDLSIVEQDSCITLQGNSSQFYMLRDRFMYELLGVMNG